MPNTNTWRDYVLKMTYQNVASPVRFYVGLTAASLTVNSTVSQAAAGEPSGGYSRQTVSLNGTDWSLQPITANTSKVRSKKVLFQNNSGSSWATVDKAFMVARLSDSPLSEILVGYAPLLKGPVTIDHEEGLTVQLEELMRGA